jgi:hypothetical protein
LRFAVFIRFIRIIRVLFLIDMNIRDAILAGRTKAHAQAIVDYVGDDPDKFAELMRLFLGIVIG